MAFTRARALLLATAVLAGPAVSAEPEQVIVERRPKIGLVLSGGGARGAAHVGVIKVLEELRIPVDYVAGTSMGSIIGGLYCSGLSPQEMEDAFGQVDWTAAFRDAPIRRYISFRRKEDDRLNLFPVELGVGIRGLSGKSGIIAGQNINFMLRTMTLHVSGRLDFDDLRIPYRAVAADLDTGEMVVLDRGDLALAMRASMSIPGVLTPVEIDGRLLIDGGLARNLPVDVALAMGAERIIAVDVGTPPRGADEELAALGVYWQTFSVLAKRNVKAQLELLGQDDVLIVPDLNEVRSAGFEKFATAVEAGDAAAREIVSQLRQFSVSEEEFDEFLARQRVGTSFEAPDVTIDSIEVRGVQGVRPEVVLERLETKAGQPLKTESLRRDLGRVMQSGEFELVQVFLEQDGDKTKLIIDAKEKPYGPGYLRFGIDLETNLDGDSDFRALAHYRRANVNRLGAEWKTLVTVGEPILVSTEFFQPLDPRGFWFVEPGLSLEKTKGETFFAAGAPLEVIETKTQLAWLDLGVQFRNWGELRVGAFRGRFDAEASTASVLEPLESQMGGWRVRATLDQFDSPFFPRHGNYSRLSAFFSRDDFGADEEYDKLLVSTLHAWSAGRNTLLAGIQVGTDLGSDIPAFDEFELGGFLNLSGFTRGELRGDVVALETLGYYFQVGDLGHLGSVYLGGILQAGNVWSAVEEVEPGDQLFSGTLFLGVDTPLSPLYLGYGRAEGGPEEFYVFMGRAF